LIHRLFCTSLLVSTIGGCAVTAVRDGEQRENSGIATQANTSAYVQSVDEAAQAVVFQPASSVDWVIAHVTIDGTRTTNVRVPATDSSYALGALPLLPGDTLLYSFTYSQNGLAQDTPQASYTIPAPWRPTAFFTEVTSSEAGSQIVVVSKSQLAWADVHYTVNGGTQMNLRLAQQGSNYVQPVALNAGDVLRYSVTYSTGSAVFDTAVSKYVAGSTGDRFVVDLGTDSTTGRCVVNGDSGGACNLRAALGAAQSATGPVTIELSVDSTVNAGQISVAAPSAGTSAIVIESPSGASAHAIQGTATDRLLYVPSGANLTLKNISIANFKNVDSGGAIFNGGALDLEGVVLSGNNTACFGVGAMTAFATCTGGAVANSGTLTLGGGTIFMNNTVSADAETAAFTNAWAAGGAIANSGTVSIVGSVLFSGNSAVAAATSGLHPAPIGGATATASGGAIYNSGRLTFADVVESRGFTPSYVFLQNSASATGSAFYGSTTLNSLGGAIENVGTIQIPTSACVFSGNSAQTGSNIDGGE
jgi:hypothetical protein